MLDQPGTAQQAPLQITPGWELGQTSQTRMSGYTRARTHTHSDSLVQIKPPKNARKGPRTHAGAHKNTKRTDTEKLSHTQKNALKHAQAPTTVQEFPQ